MAINKTTPLSVMKGSNVWKETIFLNFEKHVISVMMELQLTV
jgi:hypothetical protein